MLLRFSDLPSAVLVPFLLPFLLVVPLAGISWADDGPSEPLGRVSGVGLLDLRGIQVVDEGTVFPGSRIRTRDDAYGNVRLRGGLIIELDSNTDVVVDAAASVVHVMIESGGFSFAANGGEQSLSVDFEDFSVVAYAGSSGRIAFLTDERLDVAPFSGRVAVVHHDTGDRFLLRDGVSTVIAIGPLDPVADALVGDGTLGDASALGNEFFGGFRLPFGAFFGGPLAFKFFKHHPKKASPHDPDDRPPRGRGQGRGPRNWPPPPWQWGWW